MVTYDEAVNAGATVLFAYRGGMGERRRLNAMKHVLDAIGFRQMEERIEELERFKNEWSGGDVIVEKWDEVVERAEKAEKRIEYLMGENERFGNEALSRQRRIEELEHTLEQREMQAILWQEIVGGTKERAEKAEAAVLKLRNIVRRTQYVKQHHKRTHCNCDGCTALADTESFEQYR